MGLFKRKKKVQKFCPNCRMPIADGSAFCDACGLRVTPPPACAHCNLPLAPDTNFCESCGTPVGTPPASPGVAETGTSQAGRGKPEKSRKAQKRSPKKDEFVHPAMLVPEPSGEKTPVDLPPRDHGAVGADAGEPVVQPPVVPEIQAGKPPARFRVPGRILAVAGIGIIILILALAFLTGFVHPSLPPIHLTRVAPSGLSPETQVPEPSAAETVTSVPEQTPASLSLVPGTTQIPPESNRIWLHAERDPISNMVTVIYDGGKGQRAVRNILVRLTRSDGQVLTQTFRPLVVGEGAELQGTKYDDRLEVIITYNSGDSYTVIDKIFIYKQRN